MVTNTFEFTPIDNLSHGLFLLILVLFIGLLIVFSSTYVKATKQFVVLSTDGLTLKVPLYGRVIPLSDINISGALVVDLAVDDRYKPIRRRNGIGLPGYKLGWYKLKSGEKALLAMNNTEKLVYLPTKAGYPVLLGLNDPQKFLTSLQELF